MVRGRFSEQRVARILAVLHLVTEHLEHGGQQIGVVREPFYLLAVLEPPGGVDQKRYLEPLLVDGVVVPQGPLLAKAFPVIAVDNEDRTLAEPKLFGLRDKVLEEDVLE